MKGRILFALSLCILTISISSAAVEKPFGLGVIIGEPTGLSGKLKFSEFNSVHAGMAWSFRRNGHLHLHADYLWEFPNTIKTAEQFTLFTGIGARLAVGKGDGVFGARVVGGLAWLPYSSPLEIFVEVAPILDLAPATEMSFNGGVGIRFFF